MIYRQVKISFEGHFIRFDHEDRFRLVSVPDGWKAKDYALRCIDRLYEAYAAHELEILRGSYDRNGSQKSVIGSGYKKVRA